MRRLPPGANWLDAIYNPKKVARLRRQQLEAEAGPGFTAKQFAALVRKYDSRCLRCGKKESKTSPLVPDHIHPLSKGGEHHIRNIQPLCRQCNIVKGVTTVDHRPRNVRYWLRTLRGQCIWGSGFKTGRCKNVALWDSPLCHVHKHDEGYDDE
jgi:hypothetical protein